MPLQQTDEGVRFLIEQGKLDPDLRRKIMDAEPGEVIEWNFPEGCVPMARVNEWGGLGGLGAELLHEAHPAQVRRVEGQTPPYWKIEGEVHKHLPSRDYSVRTFRDHRVKGYAVNIVWCDPVGAKMPEVIASAIVGDYELSLCSWRIKLLEDLDEDLHRRAS